MVSPSNDALSEFERQLNTKPNKVDLVKNVEPSTDVAAVKSHIPDEVPFVISYLATLAS